MNAADFWWVLMVTCLVWYSTVTVYVSVRAVWDIRNMLDRLRELSAGPNEDDAEPPAA